MFAYDLARNIVYLRQGNPANADVDVDGDGVFRTIDLFQSTGGAPWVDRARMAIPLCKAFSGERACMNACQS